ncbi:hypothetical protein O181_046015 [Austropuccinia psidii MF-1]|uniref:Uncharacterized protein n=1 Tax=Austropuccinia psidii MF-1 TaxID=1389203 RepID=A0A9Q3DSI2_9BASI|nr:hypothetical protein [Austropuccinia psidii MF-1]
MPTLMLELASKSPPNPVQCLACICAHTPLQMRLEHCLPSLPSPLLLFPHPCLIFSLANNPFPVAGPSSYASDAALTPLTPPCTCRLPSLRWWSAFPTCL